MVNFLPNKFGISNEIINFIFELFIVVEIRGVVGRNNGITFEIRTKEKNHIVPHVLVSYGEYNVSISIADGEILDGNIPKKQMKFASQWVIEHKMDLEAKWREIRINCDLPMTQSILSRTKIK